MFCPNCGREMKTVMHFEQDKKYQFNQCPSCYFKTKNKRIHFKEDEVKDEDNTTFKVSQNFFKNKR